MSVSDIEEVTVDWETNAAAVYTKSGLRQTLGKPTVTSGCGQGTMFGDFMAEMENLNLAHEAKLSAAALFDLLAQIRVYGAVYKSSGAVHACCLAKPLGMPLRC